MHFQKPHREETQNMHIIVLHSKNGTRPVCVLKTGHTEDSMKPKSRFGVEGFHFFKISRSQKERGGLWSRKVAFLLVFLRFSLLGWPFRIQNIEDLPSKITILAHARASFQNAMFKASLRDIFEFWKPALVWVSILLSHGSSMTNLSKMHFGSLHANIGMHG